ncbi:MAG: hypothetical protein MUF51_09750 [Vicinamibacteria bacterium]|jgi:hypothetical protein|nr:hypothetical protein [Vicinamibacteria bacterium]
MFGKASQLYAFRLMPIEPQFRKVIDAQWSFTVLDRARRQLRRRARRRRPSRQVAPLESLGCPTAVISDTQKGGDPRGHLRLN